MRARDTLGLCLAFLLSSPVGRVGEEDRQAEILRLFPFIRGLDVAC